MDQKYRLAITLLAYLLVFVFASTDAQDDLSHPIYSGVPHNESWSADSRQFVFYDSNVIPFESGTVLASPAWLQYDVALAELSTHPSWSLHPLLTDSEHQLLNVASHPDGRQSFIYTSPDRQYIVYAQGTAPDEFGRWSVVLADLQQGEVFTLPIKVWDPFYGPLTFHVLWSEDNTAFVIRFLTDEGSPVFVHVNDFKDSLSNAVVTWFRLEVDGRVFLPVLADDEMIYDLSADGNQVLLSVREEVADAPTAYDRPLRLIIWSPLNPNASQVINNRVGDAIFAPGDESKLLFVNEAGLVEYDIISQVTTILRTDINTLSTRKIRFSPDGKWLAVMTSSALYIVMTNP